MVPTTTTTLEDLDYQGKLAKYQQEGNTHKGNKYVKVELIHLSSYQTEIYKRTLHGLRMYSKEELGTMRLTKKRRIEYISKKAQRILNIHKQKITNAKCNAFLQYFFPKSPITKALSSRKLNRVDPYTASRISLKDLGLTRDNVITIFMHEGILPKNFYSLEEPK